MKNPPVRLAISKNDVRPDEASVKPPLKVVHTAPMQTVLEFQPDAAELEARTPPRMARLTLYAVVLFIGLAITWASLATIDEIVVAPGRLLTTRPMLIVQPLETSAIRSIAVKVGDTVQAGQTLATLDPTFATSDGEQLQDKIDGYDSQIDRISAELAERRYVAPPGARSDETLQAELFDQRQAYFAAKLLDFDTQVAHAEATLAASREQEAALGRRLDGLHQIDQMRKTLLDQGTGSRLSYLQGRDVSLDIEANLEAVRGSQRETAQTIEQTNAERQAFVEDFRRTSVEKLVELHGDRSVAAEQLKKARLRQRMAVLTAPADAAVLEIAQRSIGSVVREAEPLFTLVPLNVPLEAEVSVAAKDIGRLAGDEPVKIKFDAFPFQMHGTASGRIRMISQDSFAPEEKGQAAAPFYKARVALGDVTLRALPPGFHLIPGMTVQAEINVGRRTVISYFLYPLIRGFDESLREP
ncbi:HlyD family type I secretion periplasmic adaptor subunit [Mesorhizobium loti]|uniref:HlyD family type I secretion periplasmic adaptor subunit n=1 Tax=Rhizobium loti TaxID=381 RepID=UPI00041B9935|nr:HlyD family type I secretion periplasmic adaptor subunit [Mesorhizobium loti]